MHLKWLIIGFMHCLIALFMKTSAALSSDETGEFWSCPDEFVSIPDLEQEGNEKPSGACYKFFAEKHSFEDAVQKCEEIGSTLATPKLEADAESLAKYILKNRPDIKRYWIGLSDQDEEGVFKWEDTENELRSNFSEWMINEPQSNLEAVIGSRGDEEDCVKMAIWIFGVKGSAKFYDTHCEKLESFICEHEPIKSQKPTMQLAPNLDKEGNISGNSGVNNRSLTDAEKQVAFMIPENYKNYERNNSKSVHNNDTLPTDVEKKFPIELIGYGGEQNEEDDSEENDKDERKSKVNTTLKSRPEISDPPIERPIIIEPEVDLKIKKDSRKNRTKTSERKKVVQRSCVLECDPSYMRAACPLKFFPQIQNTKVVLNNASCRPRRNRTHLIVHTSLDGCGTTIQNAVNEKKVSFRNTIHLIPRGSGIVRNSKIASLLTEFMVLDCRYPRHHSVVQNYHPAEGRPQVYKTIEDGPVLSHIMLLYKTPKYDCPYAREEYPVKVSLSKRVYLEVTLDMPSERIELHPITCFATPDANPYNSNNYVLMQDGCVEDNTFRIEESNSRKVSRFSVEAFRFVGYFRKVYIHCNLIVCTINSESSPQCPYACNPEGRYRRDAEELNEDERHISSHSGMINIVNDGEDLNEQNDESEQNEQKTLNRINDPDQRKQEMNKEPQALSSQKDDEDGKDDDPGNTGARVSRTVYGVAYLCTSILVLLEMMNRSC